MMRRYAMVHRARDADVFGILIGTLGVGKGLGFRTRLLAVLLMGADQL